MSNVVAWLHQGTTILGISVLVGDFSAYLLGQLTWQQAVAAALAGIVSIAMKQVSGSVVVTGSSPTVNADTVGIIAPVGSTTTVFKGA